MYLVVGDMRIKRIKAIDSNSARRLFYLRYEGEPILAVHTIDIHIN